MTISGNCPATIIRRHPLVKMIECPGKEGETEGEERWDIMTGGSNKISHKYILADTLTNTYKALHGKNTGSLGRYIEKSP